MERWRVCKNQIRITSSGAEIMCGDNKCVGCLEYEVDEEKLEKFERGV